MTLRFYGVSTGGGNIGVSHLDPGYVVKTDDPWRLAAAAFLSEFKPEYRYWVKDYVDIGGEADHTIYAIIHDECDLFEPAEVGCRRSREEDFACEPPWFILEVFPIADKEIEGLTCPVYGSMDEAFTTEGKERDRCTENL